MVWLGSTLGGPSVRVQRSSVSHVVVCPYALATSGTNLNLNIIHLLWSTHTALRVLVLVFQISYFKLNKDFIL
jgi:hypothetical protein